ncbi:hypothetical protein [uncultured Roseibium sp.]|uniref:hypothetical protein n=1 Tax=uncultured Roseibium sp. TaxID=1936171 RepID=UPI003216F32E
MTDTLKKRGIDLADLMRMATGPLIDTHAVGGAKTSAASQPPLPVPLPQSVIDWLAQACLLYGVPFEYIVPDARMLPKESIRFFYVDVNWLHRLIEGAVSTGMSSSADTVQMLTAIQEIVDRAFLKTTQVRARMRGKPLPDEAEQVGPITGFLLRSAAVSGWPGMEVTAYAGTTTDSTVLQLLRLDRLSDTIMIALFNGLPKRVDILQPPESLHFGIRPDGNSYYSFLRGLGYGGHDPGIQIGSVEAPVAMRGNADYPGVVDIANTAANLKAALKTQNALDPEETFTSAEFAVQMVRAAGLQSFEWGVTTSLEPGGVTDG